MVNNSGKQERVVVHLEYQGEHYYYGNLKALCNEWGANKIGITYSRLRNYGLSKDKPYIGGEYIIRKGIIKTTPRQGK